MSVLKEIKFRPAVLDNEADLPYIMHTWLNAYKYRSYFGKRILDSIFFKEHRKVIEHIISVKQNVYVIVACAKENENVIIGFICAEDPREDSADNRTIIHFMEVRESFRNKGISKELLKQAEIDLKKAYFTHWTFCLDDYNLINKNRGLIYNPYLI